MNSFKLLQPLNFPNNQCSLCLFASLGIHDFARSQSLQDPSETRLDDETVQHIFTSLDGNSFEGQSGEVEEVILDTEQAEGQDNTAPRSRLSKFAEYSLCCLGKHNAFRSFCISIELDPLFHQFIFVVILYNTILLGMADYGHVVMNPSSPLLGELDSRGSTRNYVISSSEVPLALFYATEMGIRVVAMGLWCVCHLCFSNFLESCQF
jgi:hypothetical protein